MKNENARHLPLTGQGGKGDWNRIDDQARFNDNWERIFGKPTKPEQVKHDDTAKR